jgi:hypothetical protein
VLASDMASFRLQRDLSEGRKAEKRMKAKIFSLLFFIKDLVPT